LHPALPPTPTYAQAELKKLQPTWPQRLSTIQAAAEAAFAALPQGAAPSVQLSEHRPRDYLLVREVRDALKETAATGLFGGLTGDAGVFNKLVTAYERQSE